MFRHRTLRSADCLRKYIGSHKCKPNAGADFQVGSSNGSVLSAPILGILLPWMTGLGGFNSSFFHGNEMAAGSGWVYFPFHTEWQREEKTSSGFLLRQKKKISPQLQPILSHFSLARIRDYLNFWTHHWQGGWGFLRPIMLTLEAGVRGAEGGG